MTEHRHDPDLILALAAGTATTDGAASVAAEVGACPQCASDLAMQRIALDALAAMPVARLTSDERSHLRSDLRGALHLDEGASPAGAQAGTSPGRPRWRPLWGLAAATAVFLAVVAVPPAFRALSPSGDDEMFQAAVGTTTSPVAEEGGDALASVEDTGRTAADPGSTLTLPVGDDAVTTDAVGSDGGVGGSAMLPVIVLDDLGDLSAVLAELAESGGTLPISPDAPSTTVEAGVVAACRESVVGGDDGYPIALTEVAGVPALVMVYPDDAGARIAVHAIDDCRVLGSAGP